MVTRKFVTLFVNRLNTLLFEETEYLEWQFIFRGCTWLASAMPLWEAVYLQKGWVFCLFVLNKGLQYRSFFVNHTNLASAQDLLFTLIKSKDRKQLK